MELFKFILAAIGAITVLAAFTISLAFIIFYKPQIIDYVDKEQEEPFIDQLLEQ